MTALLILAGLAPGCVTQRTTPSPEPGITFRPPSPLGTPVARPVTPGATVASRFTAALTPLGSVEYDGQTLPQTSPDGRYIAVQQGRPTRRSRSTGSSATASNPPRCPTPSSAARKY